MHLIEPIRSCIDDVIRGAGSGMKSMILDDFTTGIVSAGYSRSEMLLREVYLFECIDTIFETKERLNHMKCIVILRPTRSNIELLCRELNRPHYRTYHLYFTCRIGSLTIKRLSEADETEVVRCVKELPLDYQAVAPFLFTLRLENKTYDLKKDDWQDEGLKNAVDGLASVLIALQVHPLIRYQTHSSLCKTLAEKVGALMKREAQANKEWRQVAPFDVNSLLLIVDRRHDLVTPLVNNWTYYAIIHEQFGIVNNRISLVDVPNRQPKDPKEMLISVENDEFFNENYLKSYGELGGTLKQAVENLKTLTSSQRKVETMDDMKRFIDEYPETKRYASNLHNHVFLMSEITRLVTEHNLVAVSECEQELACDLAPQSDILKELRQLITNPAVRPNDAVRLVCLYVVCKPNEKASNLRDLRKLLKSRNDIPSEDLESIEELRRFNLSKPRNPLDGTVQQMTRLIAQNVGKSSVNNLLTAYRPALSGIIDEIRRGNKLKESSFAFWNERYKEEPPTRLLVFFVGGVTYDEALIADQINRQQHASAVKSPMQVVVGGTTIHNCKTFLAEVKAASPTE